MKLAVAFIGTLVVGLSAQSSFADTQIISNFTGNRMCLAIKNASFAKGASIVEYDCEDRVNQLFRFIDHGSGYYQIQSVRTGQCLDLPSGTLADGAVYQQWGCGGGSSAPNQEFAKIPVEGGFLLQNRYSGQCVAVAPHRPFANGVPLIQEPCDRLSEEVFHVAESVVAPEPLPAPAPWECTARNRRGEVFIGHSIGINGARESALNKCFAVGSRYCSIIPGSCHLQ